MGATGYIVAVVALGAGFGVGYYIAKRRGQGQAGTPTKAVGASLGGTVEVTSTAVDPRAAVAAKVTSLGAKKLQKV